MRDIVNVCLFPFFCRENPFIDLIILPNWLVIRKIYINTGAYIHIYIKQGGYIISKFI